MAQHRTAADCGFSRVQPDYPNVACTHGARVCIAWDIENVRPPYTDAGATNATLTALKRAFTLQGRRKIDSIIVVHKQRHFAISQVLPVLEKDPAVTVISVHNTFKSDFVADDILRGKIDQFLDRVDDYKVPTVLALLSGDSGFDLAVRRAQSKRCHVEILHEHYGRSRKSAGLGNWSCEWQTFLRSWGVNCADLVRYQDPGRPVWRMQPPVAGDAAFTPLPPPERDILAQLSLLVNASAAKDFTQARHDVNQASVTTPRALAREHPFPEDAAEEHDRKEQTQRGCATARHEKVEAGAFQAASQTAVSAREGSGSGSTEASIAQVRLQLEDVCIAKPRGKCGERVPSASSSSSKSDAIVGKHTGFVFTVDNVMDGKGRSRRTRRAARATRACVDDVVDLTAESRDRGLEPTKELAQETACLGEAGPADLRCMGFNSVAPPSAAVGRRQATKARRGGRRAKVNKKTGALRSAAPACSPPCDLPHAKLRAVQLNVGDARVLRKPCVEASCAEPCVRIGDDRERKQHRAQKGTVRPARAADRGQRKAAAEPPGPRATAPALFPHLPVPPPPPVQYTQRSVAVLPPPPDIVQQPPGWALELGPKAAPPDLHSPRPYAYGLR